MTNRLLLLSSLRYFRRHPWAFLLTILGVALGVGVVVSIDVAIQSSREAFRISTETVAGRATHRIVGNGDGLPDAVFAEVRLGMGIRTSAPVVEAVASSPLLPGRPLTILGVDPFSEGTFRPYLLGGAAGLDASSLLAGGLGAFVSQDTGAEAGLAVGDTLPLLVDGRVVGLELRGLLRPADGFSRRALGDVVVMDIAGAQELLRRPGYLSRIDLLLPEGTEASTRVRELQEALGGRARVLEVGTREAGLSQMIGAFDLNLTALSLLALIFGMFLIYNTLTFSVIQRRPLLGGLRSLGVTRREVMGLVLGEAVGIGLLGTSLGLALGVFLGREMVDLVARTINDLYFVLSVRSVALPPGVLVKGGLLGITATVLAALPPALEASLAPPRITQIRSVLEERARSVVPRAGAWGMGLFLGGGGLLLLPSRSLLLSFGGLFGVVMGLALLTPITTAVVMGRAAPLANRFVGILGAMAARGVVTAMSRTAPAMAALVVAVSVTVGLGTMISSFRGTVSRWLDGTLQADIYVSIPGLISSRAQGTLDPALVGRLVAGPGVDGFSTYREASLGTEEGLVRLVALELDPRGEAAFSFLSGGGPEAFRAFREGEGVFVSEPLAYRLRISLGEEISLPTDEGARRFRIAGIFYDYGSEQGVVMMSRGRYEAHWRDRGVTSLGLFVEEGLRVDEVVETLRATAGGEQLLQIRSNRALKAASLEIFDRTFAITGVLRLLTLSVAFIAVLSALMALQLERGRELGVLRANGLTPGQVWKLVTTQTGIMGLLAGALAVPAGLILAVVMVFVVNKRSFGWTLQLEVGPELLFQAVLLSVVGALLAGVLPSWRMSRTPPAAALREE